MNQLNSLIIEGNVTRDPELREPSPDFKVCTIPLAVNRFYKNNKGEGVNEVSYFDIETYGKMAEVCMKNCDKGRGLRVVGRLKQNRWKTNEGKSASRISIIAEHIEFKKRISKTESEEDLKAIADANEASIESELAMEAQENSIYKEEQIEESTVF